MKKLLAVLVLSAVSSLLSAAALSVHMGILSGVGGTWKTGKWILSAEAESSFPSYAVGNGVSFEEYGDGTFSEGFRCGALYFAGGDLSAYRTIFHNGDLDASLGLDVLSGVEIPIRNLETVLKPGIRVDLSLGEKTALFFVLNLPVLDITYARGFRTPYVRIPEYNWASVLTGWRIGWNIRL